LVFIAGSVMRVPHAAGTAASISCTNNNRRLPIDLEEGGGADSDGWRSADRDKYKVYFRKFAGEVVLAIDDNATSWPGSTSAQFLPDPDDEQPCP
jgi:hypothetical protein